MSLRKNSLVHTAEKSCEMREEQYVQAVYGLRAAEDAHEQNVSDLKMGDGFPIPEGWVLQALPLCR